MLEGTRSGLRALGHLVELRDFRERPPVGAPQVDESRRRRWLERLERLEAGGATQLTSQDSFALLDEYGVPSPASVTVADRTAAVAAAERLGFPVVLKTASPEIAHKSEARGVVLGLGSGEEVASAYDDLASRLGSQVDVVAMAAPGLELELGIVSDPMLGPLVVVGAGGVLVELLADRAIGLPPVDLAGARRMIDRLRVRPLLDGFRGSPAVDLGGVLAAVTAVSTIAVELGDHIAALDVNPLSCSPAGIFALDVLVETLGVSST